MNAELDNCPLCGGLREDGVCDAIHPTTRDERIERSFKAWMFAEMDRTAREQD